MPMVEVELLFELRNGLQLARGEVLDILTL